MISYPFEFSSAARARIERERLPALTELRDAGGQPTTKTRPKRLLGFEDPHWTNLEWDLLACIARVARAYGHEACQLGLQRIWTLDQVRRETNEFLRRFALEAGAQVRERGTRDLHSHSNGSLLPAVKRELERSEEWRQFEAEFLQVADHLIASEDTECADVDPTAIQPLDGATAGERAKKSADAADLTGDEGSVPGDVPPIQAPETSQRKGPRPELIVGKKAVSFRMARNYLGIGERQCSRLVTTGVLTVVGCGQSRKITTASLRAYLGEDNPTSPDITRHNQT